MSPFFVTELSFYTHISNYFHIHSAHRPNVVVLFSHKTSK